MAIKTIKVCVNGTAHTHIEGAPMFCIRGLDKVNIKPTDSVEVRPMHYPLWFEGTDLFCKYLSILKDSEILSEYAPPPDDLLEDNLYFKYQQEKSYHANAILLSPYRYLWEDLSTLEVSCSLYHDHNFEADYALGVARLLSGIDGDTCRESPTKGVGHSYSFSQYRGSCHDMGIYFKILLPSLLEGRREVEGDSFFSEITREVRSCKGPLPTDIRGLVKSLNVCLREE